MELTTSEKATIRRAGKMAKNPKLVSVLFLFAIVLLIGLVGFKAWAVQQWSAAAGKPVLSMLDMDQIHAGLTDRELKLRLLANIYAISMIFWAMFAIWVVALYFWHRFQVRQGKLIHRLLDRLREVGDM